MSAIVHQRVVQPPEAAEVVSAALDPVHGLHLRLVPTGADARGMRLVSRPTPLRLTRRGRILLAVLATALAVAITLVATGAFASSARQSRTIIVRAGQTLSEIAAAHLPDLSIRDAVVRVQLANALSTDQIHTGQRLRIPVP